jgi:hypothetical protein
MKNNFFSAKILIPAISLFLSVMLTIFYVSDTLTRGDTSLAKTLEVIGWCPSPLGQAPATITSPESEPGEPGAQGETGSAGPAGATGSPGVDGQDGEKGNAGPSGPAGPAGPAGAKGEAGNLAQCTNPLDISSLGGSLVPNADNIYYLGTPELRWKGLQLGPGTLYIQDTVTGEQVGMSITDGTLLLDGADSFRIGNIRLSQSGLTSEDPLQNITIGGPLYQGLIQLRGGGLEFPDGTIQVSAAPPAAPGPQGPQGPAGPAGPQGTTGATGPAGGPAGPAGPAGATGPTGSRGPTGATGPQGEPGDPSSPMEIGRQDGNQNPPEVLDLKKQVFVFNDGTWVLPEAQEGAIVHFVMGDGGSAEDITVVVERLRVIDRGRATILRAARWHPFNFGVRLSTTSLVTAVFTDEAWNITSGTIN